MRKAVLLLCGSFAAAGLFAVTPGIWCEDFHSATNYAVAHDLPLVMVWGMDGCSHCSTFWGRLNEQTALSWAAGQNAVFCHVQGNSSGQDVSPNFGALEFAIGTSGIYQTPICRFYWKGRKTEAFTAQLSESETMTFEAFKSRYETFLSDIRITASFAAFPMGSTACDRLETEYTVSGYNKKLVVPYVDIPIVRTNLIDIAATCTLIVRLRQDQATGMLTTNLTWDVGEKLKFVRYTYFSYAPLLTTSVSLTLKDPDESVIATSTVSLIPSVDNSAKNPYWIGEKTTETLGWGDWSMDLDVVTNKVAAWNAENPADPAYAMMFVGGSTWCPDCAMAEANFFTNQGFKDWAVQHKVVFGVVDIPANPQAADAFPSQLRYESYRTSDDYVTQRGNVPADETQRYQSGAGYLSRHGVDYEDALAVSERNAFLMGHGSSDGGWNTPERLRNPKTEGRTGVPILILLREDGSIAARWNRFASVAPSAYDENFLNRFEEMMAQVEDAMEELDDDRETTTRTIGPETRVEASVSAVDPADVYRLVGVEENEIVSFNVSGSAAATLKVSVTDGAGETLASVDGLLSQGITLQAKLGSGEYFLKVEPKTYDTGTFFDYAKAGSTVCSYAVTEEAVLNGGEIGFTISLTNVYENCGTVPITVARQRGNIGSATVRVRLAETAGEGVESRIGWSDTNLTWQDGEDGTRAANLVIYDDQSIRHDMQLLFELALVSAEDEGVTLLQTNMTVNVYDDETFGTRIYCNVRMEPECRTIDAYAGDSPIVLSGAIPSGITVEVVGGKLVASGYPDDLPGEWTVTYSVSGQQFVFEWTLVDYDLSGIAPSLARDRYHRNIPRVEEGVLTGLLTLFVPTDGRLTAKWVTDGTTYAYATPGWESFDATTVVANLTGESAEISDMRVEIRADGATVRFTDPAGSGPLEFELPAEYWPNGAAAYRGQYTVQMPQSNVVDVVGLGQRMSGDAYMAMRMVTEESVADGDMLYAGVLPNGRSVYGTATLLDQGNGTAWLPFYRYSDVKSSAYRFSGALSVTANAEEDRSFRWSVANGLPIAMVNDGSLGLSCLFNAYGGYYDKDEITARFNEDFSGHLDNFYFQITNNTQMVVGRYGTPQTFSAVQAEMSSTNIPHLAEAALNPNEVTLNFSPETGVVRGEFYLPFSKGAQAVTYRAIALPGWQGCDSCSLEGKFVTRPWASGSCSYADRTKAAGNFRNGCAVILDAIK